MNSHWFVIPVNPEPWSVGTISTGRKNGGTFGRMSPSALLVAYQEAVREHLDGVPELPFGDYDLRFFFWRELEEYRTESGRRQSRHVADATNMQKALEDALQGYLIDNDRNVQHIESTIVDQGKDVKPCIVIEARPWVGMNPDLIPPEVWSQVDGVEALPFADDEEPWNAPEDMF